MKGSVIAEFVTPPPPPPPFSSRSVPLDRMCLRIMSWGPLFASLYFPLHRICPSHNTRADCISISCCGTISCPMSWYYLLPMSWYYLHPMSWYYLHPMSWYYLHPMSWYYPHVMVLSPSHVMVLSPSHVMVLSPSHVMSV